MNNKTFHIIAFLLMAIGGINWLLFGVFQWEIGALFGGSSALISRVIYVLIGVAAVYELVFHKTNCKACQASRGPSPSEVTSEPIT